MAPPGARHVLHAAGDGKNHAGIPTPDQVVEALGAGKRLLVVVTVGGHTYRSAIASMGGQAIISLSAANRTAADVKGGDNIKVTIEVDTTPREVEVPEAFTALKQDTAAREVYEQLSNSRKSRLTLGVEGVKTGETHGTGVLRRRSRTSSPERRNGRRPIRLSARNIRNVRIQGLDTCLALNNHSAR